MSLSIYVVQMRHPFYALKPLSILRNYLCDGNDQSCFVEDAYARSANLRYSL